MRPWTDRAPFGAAQTLAAEALTQGACAWVQKPFGVEGLLAPVRAALAA